MTGPEEIKSNTEKHQNSLEKEKLITHAKKLFQELYKLNSEGVPDRTLSGSPGEWQKNFCDKYRELGEILQEKNITLKEVGVELSDLYDFRGRYVREGNDFDTQNPFI